MKLTMLTTNTAIVTNRYLPSPSSSSLNADYLASSDCSLLFTNRRRASGVDIVYQIQAHTGHETGGRLSPTAKAAEASMQMRVDTRRIEKADRSPFFIQINSISRPKVRRYSQTNRAKFHSVRTTRFNTRRDVPTIDHCMQAYTSL